MSSTPIIFLFPRIVVKQAPKNKIFYPYPRTTAVIDHRITIRRAGTERLKRVNVVQMEAGSAVARSSSRATRPCGADATPPRYPHIWEEASRSGLLDPRERLGLGRAGGATSKRGRRPRRGLGLDYFGCPPPPCLYSP